MKEFILTLTRMRKILGLSFDQCIYLISIEEGIQDNIPDLSLKLSTSKFTSGGNIKDEVRDVIYNRATPVKSLVVRGSYPNINRQTGDIVKRLAKTFLADGLTLIEANRMRAYTKNDYAVPFLYMFFQMFPTSGRNNKAWESHFKHDWIGVTLRITSKGTVKRLEQIWKHKDFGLFLIGTYLFIQGCRSEDSDKYFIKSIPHYLDEYEHWYNEAEDRLASGKFDKLLEKGNRVKTNTNAI